MHQCARRARNAGQSRGDVAARRQRDELRDDDVDRRAGAEPAHGVLVVERIDGRRADAETERGEEHHEGHRDDRAGEDGAPRNAADRLSGIDASAQGDGHGRDGQGGVSVLVHCTLLNAGPTDMRWSPAGQPHGSPAGCDRGRKYRERPRFHRRPPRGVVAGDRRSIAVGNRRYSRRACDGRYRLSLL